MLVNAPASFQLAEAFDLPSMDRYAAIWENTLELEHRATVNERLRMGLLR